MRLVAVNERTALYMVDEKVSSIDAVGFVSALMEVRTARDLLNLLIDHADAIAAYRFFTTNDPSFKASEPWFTEGAIRDAADALNLKRNVGLRYQTELEAVQDRLNAISTAALVDRINGMSGDETVTIDDLLSSVKHYKVIEIYLDKLHDRAERWEALFTFAAIGNGATPPRGFITSADDGASAFLIPPEDIAKIGPSGWFFEWDRVKKRKRKDGPSYWHGLYLARSFEKSDRCVFTLVEHSNDPQVIIQTVCGAIAAWGLSSWCGGAPYFETFECEAPFFKYEYGRGFYPSSQSNLVNDALRDVIVNDQIRLCSVCGKPFVAKRKSRQYCGDVCKQKAFTARKEGR